MTKTHVFITTALMLFVVASTSLAQSFDKPSLIMNSDKYQWKLEDTEDGCQIYTSKVAGKAFIAAKATCVIPARLEVIGMVLRDIANYPEWMHNCKETKVLKVVDEQNDVFILWYRNHVPILTDRDMVLKTERIMGKGWGYIKTILTTELPYDADQGYVRMRSFVSEHLLEWIDGDREKTKMTFFFDADPGKGVPVGITNGILEDTPYKSLIGIKKMIKMQKYIDSAKTSNYAKLVEDGIKDGTLK
jgi:hypothetical protein